MNILKSSRRRLSRLISPAAEPVAVNVLTGYAEWARNYPAMAHNPLMALEEQAMLELLPDVVGQTCLDLACGSGRYMRLLIQHRAKTVFGVDYSADMLLEAKRNLGSEIQNPKLSRSPFLTLPFANKTFDVITCALSVGHEKNLGAILMEAARVLTSGGTLIYSDFHPFGALSGWQRAFTTTDGTVYHLEHHIHLYSDHLRACQKAGLTIETVFEPIGGEVAPTGFEKMPLVLVIRAVKING